MPHSCWSVGACWPVSAINPSAWSSARPNRLRAWGADGDEARVSLRIKQDLVRRLGFDPKWTVCIPHGVGDAAGVAHDGGRQPRPLRAISIGRIEDAAKGIFWLPKILERVPSSIRLTIAGDGPDLPELRRRCVALGNRVTFLGNVQVNAVPALLGSHDVLLMPSRYEGFGMTVIESMAAGCIPLVARIKGVTDEIITDGLDGMLFPPGDVASASR